MCRVDILLNESTETGALSIDLGRVFPCLSFVARSP